MSLGLFCHHDKNLISSESGQAKFQAILSFHPSDDGNDDSNSIIVHACYLWLNMHCGSHIFCFSYLLYNLRFYQDMLFKEINQNIFGYFLIALQCAAGCHSVPGLQLYVGACVAGFYIPDI